MLLFISRFAAVARVRDHELNVRRVREKIESAKGGGGEEKRKGKCV